ncbi:tRNA (guanine(37)-N1)-methyltransferase 1 [Aristolochia californica]|uniref:tRNA (guanine(37)-N1)-methyltransferase 1 n=1 Tax=Aristolochia californica TaxID=171875 RepID=UPI0035D71667
MASRLVLRPHSLLSLSFSPQTCFFPVPITVKSCINPFFSSFSSTLNVTLDGGLPYGPSLRKGRKPAELPVPVEEETEADSRALIDYNNFVRVFEVAAIRVPAEQCFALESRLRGHLLNWPRIRNIARVPGDEIEPEFRDLLAGSSDESEKEERISKSLSRRIYGKADGDGEPLPPVLYREKLAKTFNCRGFLKFRNLAKISRPKKKAKRVDKDGNTCERRERTGKNDFVVVEVVENGDENDDFSGLLGANFKGTRWRHSTRLLLLDEQYANKDVEALPQAVKAILNENPLQGGTLSCELMQCRLTLFYNYWQANEILEALLPEGMIIPSAFETVGHIAHINLKDEQLPYKKLIAQVILDKNRPKIQTVVNKIDSIQNDYRTMQLEVLTGNHSLVTTLVENGIRFHVDLATVYWNSRLATERQRLVNSFSSKDIVCDVFSGVGPIAISAAKKVKYVYANDLNPSAVEYLERNVVLNKLDRKIQVFNMDGRRFIKSVFPSQRSESITQVVMNLPNDASEYLDEFRGVFRKKQKAILPKIHVYGFSKAQDPELDFQERIRSVLSEEAFDIEMHRVRLVAPGKWMLCASFILPEAVAFANEV